MASSTVNFMSYNSTGMNTIKTDWIRDLIKTCDIQFFQLQEHFKKIKTLDNYFKNEFPLSDSYVIPAYSWTRQWLCQGWACTANI